MQTVEDGPCQAPYPTAVVHKVLLDRFANYALSTCEVSSESCSTVLGFASNIPTPTPSFSAGVPARTVAELKVGAAQTIHTSCIFNLHASLVETFSLTESFRVKLIAEIDSLEPNRYPISQQRSPINPAKHNPQGLMPASRICWSTASIRCRRACRPTSQRFAA